MLYFSTYFDRNYLANGLALIESLQATVREGFVLFVLALDDEVVTYFEENPMIECSVIALSELERFDSELFEIKSSRSRIEYMFTITPCLLRYLLSTFQDVDILTYVDADVYFYSSPRVILDEMMDASVILVPHFFPNVLEDRKMYGIYNVVFNPFRSDELGLLVLDWWRERCIEWCYDRLEDGKFADQKYLEGFLGFEKVGVCNNRGVNLGPFNMQDVVVRYENAKWYVDDRELVFVHFHGLRIVNKYVFQPNLYLEGDSKRKDYLRIYNCYVKKVAAFRNEIGNRSSSIERYAINEMVCFEIPIRVLEGKFYVRFGKFCGMIRSKTIASLLWRVFGKLKLI